MICRDDIMIRDRFEVNVKNKRGGRECVSAENIEMQFIVDDVLFG